MAHWKTLTGTLFFTFTFFMTNGIFAQQDFDWAVQVGDTNFDLGKSIALDHAGNVYTTGWFERTVDFDPGTGTDYLTSVSFANDIYIQKLDMNGNHQWARSIGWTDQDFGEDIVVDGSGNVYVTGYYRGDSVDFDPSSGVSYLYGGTGTHAFVLKLDSAGNFIWATTTATNVGSDAKGYSIDLDASNNVYICGEFNGTVDFDPGIGTFNMTAPGGLGTPSDAFVLKLDSNGAFQWATQMSSSGGNKAWGLTIDHSGNVLTTGWFQGTVDFDPGTGVHNLSAASGIGVKSMFIQKLNSNGDFVWAEMAGGYAHGFSIAVDSLNNVYSTGTFIGSVDFDPSSATYNIVPPNTTDHMFIWKLDSAANFVWAKPIFGTYAGADPHDIELDKDGNVYTCGNYRGAVDFDPSSGVATLLSGSMFSFPTDDGFILKWDGNGNFLWVKQLGDGGAGNSLHEDAYAVAISDQFDVYSTGFFWNTTDFDPDPIGQYNLNAAGYHDIFTLKLKGHCTAPTDETLNATECGSSYVSPSGNYTWSAPGTYFDSVFHTNGCDTFFTVNLSFANPTFENITVTSCDSFASPSGNHMWYASGIYDDTLQNSNGCDSVLTIDLSIVNASAGNATVSACNSYTSPSGNHTWFTSGTYLDTIQSSAGCDSAITIDLSILYATTGSMTASACDSFASPSGNHLWYTSGVFSDTLTNAAGCDSILSIDLSILNSTVNTMFALSCDEWVSPSGNHVWTASGVYTDTMQNSAGCDSLITVNLTIDSVSTNALTITQNGNTLVSGDSNASSYQWVDCENGFSPISGANSYSYAPSASGNYALIVTENGCTDTSDCRTIEVTGIGGAAVSGGFEIFPNPTQGLFTIRMDQSHDAFKVIIFNALGEVVQHTAKRAERDWLIDLSDEPSGLYFVTIESEDGSTTLRLAKE